VFERRPCGTGSKGPRLFDWALVATSDPCQVLLIRRLITRPDQLAYFICHVPDPAKIRLPYLATIAGRRWPVEETFKTVTGSWRRGVPAKLGAGRWLRVVTGRRCWRQVCCPCAGPAP
jgi:hypothetical protein